MLLTRSGTANSRRFDSAVLTTLSSAAHVTGAGGAAEPRDLGVLRVGFPRFGRLVWEVLGDQAQVQPPDFVVCDAATHLRDEPRPQDHNLGSLVLQVQRSRLA